MIFRHRPDIPTCLSDTTQTSKWGRLTNQEKWGKQFKAKLEDPSKRNDFQWMTYNGQKVNRLLVPILKAMTQNHCSFCDIFPIRQAGGTIEHFYPKIKFPLLSHTWTNVFYCCHACQEKSDDFDEALLKPDEATYSFDYYFVVNYNSLEIEPNPQRSQKDQQRAKITIQLYHLNDFDRPEDRARALAQYNDANHPDIDDFPYRYLFLCN